MVSGMDGADTNDTRTPIARFIIDRRKAKGMSQEQLADAAGMSASFIAFIETGRRGVSKESAVKLADGLDLSRKDRTELLAFVREEQPSLIDRVARLEVAVADLLDRYPAKRQKP